MPDKPVVRRDELAAAVAARRELPEHEDELVAGFLDRIERGLDRRIDEKLAQRKLPSARGRSRDGAYAVTFVSLGCSIPLLGIASGSLIAMAMVLAALVLVNAIVWRS